MVGIAQLGERQIVALKVMGSNPITHPIYYFRVNIINGVYNIN